MKTHQTSNNKSHTLLPADFVLLEGICVINEAMLTGESAPQVKDPLGDS